MSELTKEKLDELELFADACSQRGFGQVDTETLLSLIAAARELDGVKASAMTADVLDVGDAPNGKIEVTLSCSRQSARAWGKALYTTIIAIPAPEPTNGR